MYVASLVHCTLYVHVRVTLSIQNHMCLHVNVQDYANAMKIYEIINYAFACNVQDQTVLLHVNVIKQHACVHCRAWFRDAFHFGVSHSSHISQRSYST